MASEQYKVFSENEKNIKGESMVEIGIKICLRNKTKIWKSMEKITDKICLKKTNRKRKTIWKNTKTYSKNVPKKIIENNELERVEVDVITNFIKGKVKRFADARIYTGDNDNS